MPGDPVAVSDLQPSQVFSVDGRQWWICRKVRQSGDVVLVYCQDGPVRPFPERDVVYIRR